MGELLDAMGYGRLMERFQQQQIDFKSLLLFETDDFKELGVALGPRKKLLAKIAKLR